MMKRLADQRVLTRAARGVYVNSRARSMPGDVRAGLIRFFALARSATSVWN